MQELNNYYYKLLFGSNPSPIIIFEASTGKIFDVNNAALKLYGYNKDEFECKNLKDLFTYKDQIIEDTGRKHNYLHKIKSGSLIEVELLAEEINFNNTPSKVLFIKKISGGELFSRLLLSNLEGDSGRIEESAIKESEEILSIIIHNAPIILFAIDKDKKFLIAEGKGFKGTGLNQQELKGKPADQFFDKISITEDTGNIISGKDALRRVYKGKTVEGITRINQAYFDTRFSPLYDRNDKIAGVIGVAVNITERKLGEEEREKLLREVVGARSRLKSLSRKLIEVQESERRLIARELHDEVGQTLTALKIDLQTAVRFKDFGRLKDHLLETIELSEHALNHVRNLSLDLRPSLLDDLGLLPALRWYIDRQSQRTGIQMKITSDSVEKKISPDLEVTCYRLTQEAVTNIIRHANAKNVKIELYLNQDTLHLSITDDGKGFNVFSTLQRAVRGESMGVLGMQERVELVGGRLHISSTEGTGTVISAILPLDQMSKAEHEQKRTEYGKNKSLTGR